jgi:hypothetical protein
MTSREFDLLDEIYFVQSFDSLSVSLGWEDAVILSTLKSLYSQGWIRCYHHPTKEVLPAEIDLENNYQNYHYLASKEGLIAHNSIE